jgi:hypothetical protein
MDNGSYGVRRAKRAWRFFIPILICFLVSLALLIYPVYVIRPFRAQGARELMVALAILRFRLPAVVLCSLIALAALARHWHQESRWLFRTMSAVGALAIAAMAILCRINIYELMFHPFDRPSFVAVAQATLDKDEKVVAIKVSGEARGYPIRIISYHHVINDVVGTVPIVATY